MTRNGSRDAVLTKAVAILRYGGLVYVKQRAYMPPLRSIAKEMGCSTRTVRRYLEVLEQEGYDVPKWRDEVTE